MTAPLRQLALVSQSAAVTPSQLAQVSAALQKQVTRDLGPIWDVSATVDAFPRLEDVPPGYYAVIVRDDVETTRGVKGVHFDPDRQPFALVQSTPDNLWSVFASHEVLEMLVDPSLNRLVPSASIHPGQGRVTYIQEICDPCQDPQFSYTVNDVRVCDFYTPHYFDPVTASGVRYSFTGSLSGPRDVLEGGYLAWVVPETGEWFMGFVFQGRLRFMKTQPIAQAMSVREFIDHESARLPFHATARRRRSTSSKSTVASSVGSGSALRARRLQGCIDALMAGAAAPMTRQGQPTRPRGRRP